MRWQDIGLAAVLAGTAGCRADVEGDWTGTVGAERAELSLAQKGSAIGGDVCLGQRCARIDDGTLEEQSLVLTFGCDGCPVPRATLDLVLDRGLQGDRHLWRCACTPAEDAAGECACRAPAAFTRCQGRCR